MKTNEKIVTTRKPAQAIEQNSSNRKRVITDQDCRRVYALTQEHSKSSKFVIYNLLKQEFPKLCRELLLKMYAKGEDLHRKGKCRKVGLKKDENKQENKYRQKSAKGQRRVISFTEKVFLLENEYESLRKKKSAIEKKMREINFNVNELERCIDIIAIQRNIGGQVTNHTGKNREEWYTSTGFPVPRDKALEYQATEFLKNHEDPFYKEEAEKEFEKPIADWRKQTEKAYYKVTGHKLDTDFGYDETQWLRDSEV